MLLIVFNLHNVSVVSWTLSPGNSWYIHILFASSGSNIFVIMEVQFSRHSAWTPTSAFNMEPESNDRFYGV